MAKHKEILYQRPWAETVRLYSGLLQDGDRQALVKKVARRDILLAAECRATWFTEESELDAYLERIAIDEAVQFKKTESSARGLIALAELNKFDVIADIFKAIPDGGNKGIHNEVVIQYVTNGTELQIITLLRVLAEYNLQLLHRALDRVLDLNLVFSGEIMAQAAVIAEALRLRKERILGLKLICVFRLRQLAGNADQKMQGLIKARLVKYAERFVSVAKERPQLKAAEALTDYVEHNEPKQTIEALLNLYIKIAQKPQLLPLRLILSRHLNPLVKQLAVSFEADGSIGRDTAYQICLNNIQIGNRTAIEFTQQVIKKFGLSDLISPEMLITALLHDPRPQRLEMAYRLVLQYEAYHIFPFKYLFHLLVGSRNFDCLTLAGEIVRLHFPKQERYRYFEYLCCVGMTDERLHKLTREIALKELFAIANEENDSEELVYIGVVTPSIKKNFNIVFGPAHETLPLKQAKYPTVKMHNFITFKLRFSRAEPPKKYIAVMKTDLFDYARKQYLFKSHFIGEILDLRVTAVYLQRAFLSRDRDQQRFVIPLEEAGLPQQEKMDKHFKPGDVVQVRLKSFDREYHAMVCSVTDIMPRQTNTTRTEDDFKNKLTELQKKYSRIDPY